MNPKIKSLHVIFIMIGTILWIAVGILVVLNQTILSIIASSLAIMCFAIALFTYYYNPKPKRIGYLGIHGIPQGNGKNKTTDLRQRDE